MKSNIKRIRICWVSGSNIVKNSVYVVYNTGTPRTYLFESLLDLPTTVFNYYIECLESLKYKLVWHNINKATKTVRTFILYDKALESRFDE